MSNVIKTRDLKKSILFISFILLTVTCFGQGNYHKLSLGAGFGPTISYADVREKSQSYGGYGEFLVNLTPFVTTGLEFQIGKVKGGDIVTDPHNRQFVNNYKTFSLNVKAALGQFIDYSRNDFYSAIKGLYVGLGIGAIRNDLGYIVRYKPNTAAQYPPLGYEFPGMDKSTNLLMPVNLGINFYFTDNYNEQRYVLNFNYQGNFTFGEGLDGYDDPIGIFKNNGADVYTFLSVGLKYNFGPSRSSRKIF